MNLRSAFCLYSFIDLLKNYLKSLIYHFYWRLKIAETQKKILAFFASRIAKLIKYILANLLAE